MHALSRYQIVRWSILGFGGLGLSALAFATWYQWRAIQPWVEPQVLGCGCQTLAVQASPWMTGWSAALLALTIVAFGRLLWSFGRRFVQQRNLLKYVQHDSRTTILSNGAFLVTNHQPHAMTIGIWRPRVIITTGLWQRLGPDEREAVIRHEQAHQRSADPFWSALIESIAHAWFWLPWMRTWVQAAWRLRELAADAFASNEYHDIDALASAILKLSPEPVGATPAFSANRDRVEKILDHRWQPRLHLWRWPALLSGIFVAVGLGLLVQSSTATAKTMANEPAGACQETIRMCRGTVATPPAMSSVCIERNGWRCTLEPVMSYYDLRDNPR